MVPRSNLQLLSLAGGPPGSAGFKLTGSAPDGGGLCRIWLRRKDPWTRYLDPRFRSDDWDVRCYRRTDSAFSLVEEFRVATLDTLAEEFTFEGDGIAVMKPNGDIVHDTVLAWAKRVLGTPADGPGDIVPAAEVEPEPETTNAVPVRVAPEPAAEAAPAEEPAAAPADEAASADEPAAAPVEEPPEEAAPAEEPAAETGPADEAAPGAADGTGTLAMSPVKPRSTLTSDAWDEIADLAERATTDATETTE